MKGELKGFVAKASPWIIFICLALAVLLSFPQTEGKQLGNPSIVAFVPGNNTFHHGLIILNTTIDRWSNHSTWNCSWYYYNGTKKTIFLGSNQTPTNITGGEAEFGLWWNTSVNITDINETRFNCSCTNTSDIISVNTTNVTIDNAVPSSVTFITVNPANNTYFAGNFTFINISFVEDLINGATGCVLEYDNFSVAGLSNTSTNVSSHGNLRNCWWNFTGLLPSENRTNNWSIYISDSAKNVYRSSIYFNTIDTIAPLVTLRSWNDTFYNYTIDNTSTYAYLNITINFTDWNYDTTWLNVFDQNNASVIYYPQNESSVYPGKTGQVRRMAMKITNISGVDGNFTLEVCANDTAGNSVCNATNVTGRVTHLIGGRWAIITHTSPTANWTANNLSADCKDGDGIPYLHYVARWKNAHQYKNWTTWSKGAPTVNKNLNLTRGEPIAIYVNTSVTYFQAGYLGTTTNYSMTYGWTNATGPRNTTNWNAIGRHFTSSANKTLHAYEFYACGNSTGANITVAQGWSGYYGNCTPHCVPTSGCTMHQNVSSIAFYNHTSDIWVSCFIRYDRCFGLTQKNISEVMIPATFPIWYNSQANWTLDVTEF